MLSWITWRPQMTPTALILVRCLEHCLALQHGPRLVLSNAIPDAQGRQKWFIFPHINRSLRWVAADMVFSFDGCQVAATAPGFWHKCKVEGGRKMVSTTRIPVKPSVLVVFPGREIVTLISKVNSHNPILSSRLASSFRAPWQKRRMMLMGVMSLVLGKCVWTISSCYLLPHGGCGWQLNKRVPPWKRGR